MKLQSQLVVDAVLLILLFSGLVLVLRSAGRIFFLLELMGLVVLLALSLGAFLYSPWRKLLFFTIFLLYLSNLVLIWYFKDNLYLVLLLLAILGFVLSFPSPAKAVQKKKEKKEELHSMVFEEPKQEEAKVKSSTTVYSPGKYVASRQSNVYHEPKCEWARKIEKSRRVWFSDVKEAVEKGFKAHGCVN